MLIIAAVSSLGLIEEDDPLTLPDIHFEPIEFPVESVDFDESDLVLAPDSILSSISVTSPKSGTILVQEVDLEGSLQLADIETGKPTPTNTPTPITQQPSYTPSIPSRPSATPYLQPPAFLRKPGKLRSLAVIVPTYNSAARLLRTLHSAEQSIQYFLNKHPRGSTVVTEVIVVDDASTDSTVSKVLAYMRKRRELGSPVHSWKLVTLPHNLGPGAARNFGVRQTTADVIFFLDSDDLYGSEHVYVCFTALDEERRAMMVATSLLINEDNIHPEWLDRISLGSPMTKCVIRDYHQFIEGFPEGAHFPAFEDVGYVSMLDKMSDHLHMPLLVRLSKKTCQYIRYPGNSLDQQLHIFTKPPSQFTPTREEEAAYNPYSDLQGTLFAVHSVYLSRKLEAALAGRVEPPNGHWAIYQAYIDTNTNGNEQEVKKIVEETNLGTLRWALHDSFATFLDTQNRPAIARQMGALAETLLLNRTEEQRRTFAYEAAPIYYTYSY